MSGHDAGYFSQRDRTQGIPERDTFFARNLLQQAIELDRLEQLPWPKNLCGKPASITELLAETAQLSDRTGENPDNVCSYGCRKTHKHNVSQTVRNPHGLDVMYFWSETCKSKWNRERMRRPASGL